MNAVQGLLPILVPMSGAPIPVRLESLEQEMLARAKAQSGFSRNELIRRAVKYARLQAQQGAASDFLVNCPIPVSRARDSHGRAGRKTRREKVAALQKSIRDHLRAAEIERKALAALTDGHAIPNFSVTNQQQETA